MGKIFILTLFLISCGRDDLNIRTSKDGLGIDFQLNALPGAKTISYHIVACHSGYQENLVINKNQGQFRLYLNDRGCVVKISSFFLRKKQYSIVGEISDYDFSVSEIVPFFNSDNGKTVYLRVDTQLMHSLSGSQHVGFTMLELITGKKRKVLSLGKLAGTNATEGKNMKFVVSRVEIVQTLESRSTFAFVFSLSCKPGLVFNGDPSTSTCNQIPLSSMSYKLIEDVYESSPCTNENVGACELLFDGSEAAIDFESDLILPTEDDPGGFLTAQGSSVLVGPDRIREAPNMILLLRSVFNEKLVFRYFNIDLSVHPSY